MASLRNGRTSEQGEIRSKGQIRSLTIARGSLMHEYRSAAILGLVHNGLDSFSVLLFFFHVGPALLSSLARPTSPMNPLFFSSFVRCLVSMCTVACAVRYYNQFQTVCKIDPYRFLPSFCLYSTASVCTTSVRESLWTILGPPIFSVLKFIQFIHSFRLLTRLIII